MSLYKDLCYVIFKIILFEFWNILGLIQLGGFQFGGGLLVFVKL